MDPSLRDQKEDSMLSGQYVVGVTDKRMPNWAGHRRAMLEQDLGMSRGEVEGEGQDEIHRSHTYSSILSNPKLVN
jgi:hypothetical protein